jgi:AcrR family transcriptional regulator
VAKQTDSPSRAGRRLKLKRRAERMDETQRRITQAAVELHEMFGPLRTSISAIAERAGVQRLTVYNHFPDERSLFDACTKHYFEAHPAPDPARWSEVADPRLRLNTGLKDLYAYWQGAERMMESILRDYEVDPDRIGSGVAEYLAHVRDSLASGWRVRGRRGLLLIGAIGHAVHFRTWRSLVREQGLEDSQAVDLMENLVLLAAQSP